MPPDPLPDFIPDVNGKKAPAALPEFIPQAKPDERPLANRPNESGVSGTLKNLGTSIIKGLPHVPSPANPVFVSDLQGLTDYLVMRGHSIASGKSMEELQQRRAALRKQAEDTPIGRALSFIPKTPTGEQVVAPILERTGEYVPQSTPGRIGSTAVQAATSMSPGKAGAALAKRILMGATTGAAGETATEYTGDPLAGIIASSATPWAIAKAAKYSKPIIDEYRPSQASKTADARLLAETKDLEQALRRLAHPEQTIVPGSDPSTAEATLDPGLIAADKMAKAKTAQYQMAQKAREARQNTARRDLIDQNADAGADPVAVSNQFRKYVKDVEAEHQQRVGELEKKAKDQASGIAKADLDERGQSLRTGLSETKGGEQKRLGALLDSIDPDGKLHVVASPVLDRVNEILREPNRDLAPHSALAEEALNKAASLKGVVPLARLRALDQALTKLMKQAGGASQDPGYADIVSLKGAVKDALANAVENQVKYEAERVARGEMAPEDTFAHKLRQHVDAFYEDKARTSASAGTEADAALRSGTVSEPARGVSGRGTEAGGEGLPSPNLEPDTAQRLAAANKQYGEFKSLYGTEPLAGALKIRDGGMKGDYRPPDAKVAASAFPAGDNGYNATAIWLKGNKSPEALSDIKAIAISRLREMMKGETLDPDVLNKWRAKYGPALKAIDEVSPGFSDNFNTPASTGRALNRAMEDREIAVKEAQQGEAARFLNLKDADDVRAMVGTAMSAKNSGQRMGEIVDRMKGNDAALAGLRKAAVDWLLGRTGASNAGMSLESENFLSTDKITKFVDANPSAIQKLFGDEGLMYLRAVAKDMQRTQQVLSAQSTAGSDTASKLFGNMLDRFQKHQEGGTVSDALNLVSAGEFFHGEPLTAAKIKIGQKLWEKAQGLLDAQRAKGNEKITSLMLKGLDNPAVAKVMLERAIDAQGRPNIEAFTKLYQLLGATQQAEEAERRGRASGGKVQRIDHAAKASQLLRLAEKAKKAHGRSTEKLLRYPDELITSALKLANQEP